METIETAVRFRQHMHNQVYEKARIKLSVSSTDIDCLLRMAVAVRRSKHSATVMMQRPIIEEI